MSDHPRRSIPMFAPRPMTVRYAYGAAPVYQLAEQPQPVSAPVVDVIPREIEVGWWVIQWRDGEATVEPATDEEVDRWTSR